MWYALPDVGNVVHIELAVAGVTRIEREPEQTLLAIRADGNGKKRRYCAGLQIQNLNLPAELDDKQAVVIARRRRHEYRRAQSRSHAQRVQSRNCLRARVRHAEQRDYCAIY